MSSTSTALWFVCFLSLGCINAPDESVPFETTPGEIALGNLSARIDGLESAYQASGSPSLGMNLVDQLLSRPQFTGSFGDFARANNIVAELEEQLGDAPEFLLQKARVANAQHLFDRALLDLDRARQLGADVDDPQSTVQLALGHDLDVVLATRQVKLKRSSSFSTHSAVAAAYAALGEFDLADAHYDAAEEAYGDVSPLPLAWAAFQRGVMWAEKADDAALGRHFYEQAVELVPSYVVANVHLAELEAQDGDLDLAVARLGAIASETEDPEPSGLLAELIHKEDAVAAEALSAHASSTYDVLLERYPRAFLDHASEFFGAPSPERDLDRSLALALENLIYRQDARAFIVALESARSVGDYALICSLVEEAREAEGVNRNLGALLSELECAP